MSDEIVNRVSESKLITFNLEDYYPKGKRVVIDIKDWLYEDFILREKEFRAYVSSHNWEQYEGAFVALTCSTDAIIPGWANMLIASSLQPFAKRVIVGDSEQLETSLYQSVIENIDITPFQDKMVIIKGCSNKPVPPNAYLLITSKLQKVVKSLMYGEACSSVPLYKKK